MAWGRIDDSLYDHPKVDELGRHRLPCMGLYVLAISWSNRYLTDGYIPVDRVKRLGGTPVLAEWLVRVGLWDKVAEGYRIHDFFDYNDSAERVRNRRASFRDLGRKGAEVRWRGAIGLDSGALIAPSSPVPIPNPSPSGATSKKKSDA
jgi:hypothetical protein